MSSLVSDYIARHRQKNTQIQAKLVLCPNPVGPLHAMTKYRVGNRSDVEKVYLPLYRHLATQLVIAAQFKSNNTNEIKQTYTEGKTPPKGTNSVLM